MASKKSYKIPKQSSGVLFVDSLPNVEMKTCRSCNITKPLSEYPKRSQYKDKKDFVCKVCRNIKSRGHRKAIKIAPKKPKDNKCECCGKVCKVLCIDHDHNDLTFRGHLCSICNRAIGQLGDTFDGVMNAIKYLRKVEMRKMVVSEGEPDSKEIFKIKTKVNNRIIKQIKDQLNLNIDLNENSNNLH